MKFYKTLSGEVRAIDKDQESLVQSDWSLMTDKEIADYLNPPKNRDQVLAEEQAWVNDEMHVADIKVNLHLDGDARATATESAWRAYRCQLRDYVKDGIVVGDRPQKPV